MTLCVFCGMNPAVDVRDFADVCAECAARWDEATELIHPFPREEFAANGVMVLSEKEFLMWMRKDNGDG